MSSWVRDWVRAERVELVRLLVEALPVRLAALALPVWLEPSSAAAISFRAVVRLLTPWLSEVVPVELVPVELVVVELAAVDDELCSEVSRLSSSELN